MVSTLDLLQNADQCHCVFCENNTEFCTDLSSFLSLQLYQLHGIQFMQMAITLVYVPLFGIQCYTCIFSL